MKGERTHSTKGLARETAERYNLGEEVQCARGAGQCDA